ncbi:protein mono-ADP-ribosyltransferase PARP11-like [Branchiostoma floridae]|uniref:Protein mono-ADP-ribosyltransferase PARP11-like n=1 Tax=Branchiostoma floridae TaxID=7739 RepID=A0A9J7MTZ5_BRAFL|nr:protein mono-ADP-ribosyltransferase PARP11-like [Branchiostoma floridae]
MTFSRTPRFPKACTWYNNRDRGCSKGHTCTFLHVCQFYLQGGCRFGAQRCDFSHNLHDPQPMAVLSEFGIDGSKPESFLLEMLSSPPGVTPPRSAQLSGAAGARRRTPSGGGGPSRQGGGDDAGKGTEICTFNLRNRCSFGDTCHNWHCALPYQWQCRVAGDETWQDYNSDSNIVIEKQFCDVTNGDVCLLGSTNKPFSVVNFKDMKSRPPQDASSLLQRLGLAPTVKDKVYVVRRLSTPSWGVKPAGYPFVTEWRWYWRDDGGTWVEYGQTNNSGAKGQSSLTSQDIEERFQDQPDAELTFNTQHHQYVLRLRDMQQENVSYQTRRDVRRRPCFVSEDDVTNPRRNKPTARRRLTSGSSGADDSLPAHWRAMAEDGDDYDEVPLSPSGTTAGEYQRVRALFEGQGMAGTPVINIKRVQNPYLWSAYVRKKAQMKKQSGGTDPEERQLFHGTKPEVVDAICLQNFDWRLSGTSTGALYGQGSYFSTSSEYSNRYAQQTSGRRRTMFVAQVLVGAYTTGQKTLRRPPPLNPSEPLGRTFDSCVNSRTDPTIFVVFDSAQCYPEYLIEY